MPTKTTANNLLDRFTAKYIVRLDTGCWEWVGANMATNSHAWPYGQMRILDKCIPAHRISWELHNGPIPAKVFVCHHCDNPSCVNPAHLFLGNQKANVADMDQKGRRGSCPGESHINSKLTEDQVRQIRESPLSSKQMARSLPVNDSVVRAIRRRDAWSHVL